MIFDQARMVVVPHPDRDFEIKAAGPERALDGLESGFGAPSFPARDHGLVRAQARGQVTLRQAGAQARFLDEETTGHPRMISDPIYARLGLNGGGPCYESLARLRSGS